MKYFLIAGEASGDLHTARLMRVLKREDPDASFMYQGGDLMAAEGGTLLRHFRDSSFMLLEVVLHLRTILRNMRIMKEEMVKFEPDLVILIDYPGFNLRMARFASERGMKVFYYISPKVWAWKKGRIRLLKKYVDKLFVIFPFEVEYFNKRELKVEYPGNPLVDAVEEFKSDYNLAPDGINGTDGKPLIALLAGSRKQEIRRCLPVMLEAAKAFPKYRFILAGAPSIEESFYKKFLEGTDVGLVMNRTYELLAAAHAAVVTSGTATLETALFRVPQVVVYRMGYLTFLLGTILLKIPYISLVNIILQKPAVKELIQVNLVSRITMELRRILEDGSWRTQMLDNYTLLHDLLGESGASERTGRRMYELLTGTNS